MQYLAIVVSRGENPVRKCCVRENALIYLPAHYSRYDNTLSWIPSNHDICLGVGVRVPFARLLRKSICLRVKRSRWERQAATIARQSGGGGGGGGGASGGGDAGATDGCATTSFQVNPADRTKRTARRPAFTTSPSWSLSNIPRSAVRRLQGNDGLMERSWISRSYTAPPIGPPGSRAGSLRRRPARCLLDTHEEAAAD
jgi:hypothetical protein